MSTTKKATVKSSLTTAVKKTVKDVVKKEKAKVQELKEQVAQTSAALQVAQAKVAQLQENLEFTGEAEAAENELYNALADIGLREKKDDTMDNILLVVCKTASELIYRYFGPRGFSDPYGV